MGNANCVVHPLALQVDPIMRFERQVIGPYKACHLGLQASNKRAPTLSCIERGHNQRNSQRNQRTHVHVFLRQQGLFARSL